MVLSFGGSFSATESMINFQLNGTFFNPDNIPQLQASAEPINL